MTRRRWIVLAVVLLLAVAGYTAHRLTTDTTFDEHDNGRTVRVAVGDTFRVTLHSTYWRFAEVPGGGTLLAVGAPRVVDSTPCHPGEGCGTVTLTVRAGGSGTVTLSAHRDSCGEALACGPGQGAFSLAVEVHG
jgi:hypothetical protein